jgi:hypothetical protein
LRPVGGGFGEHSAADGLSPVNYEIRESKTKPEAA